MEINEIPGTNNTLSNVAANVPMDANDVVVPKVDLSTYQTQDGKPTQVPTAPTAPITPPQAPNVAPTLQDAATRLQNLGFELTTPVPSVAKKLEALQAYNTIFSAMADKIVPGSSSYIFSPNEEGNASMKKGFADRIIGQTMDLGANENPNDINVQKAHVVEDIRNLILDSAENPDKLAATMLQIKERYPIDKIKSIMGKDFDPVWYNSIGRNLVAGAAETGLGAYLGLENLGIHLTKGFNMLKDSTGIDVGAPDVKELSRDNNRLIQNASSGLGYGDNKLSEFSKTVGSLSYLPMGPVGLAAYSLDSANKQMTEYINYAKEHDQPISDAKLITEGLASAVITAGSFKLGSALGSKVIGAAAKNEAIGSYLLKAGFVPSAARLVASVIQNEVNMVPAMTTQTIGANFTSWLHEQEADRKLFAGVGDTIIGSMEAALPFALLGWASVKHEIRRTYAPTLAKNAGLSVGDAYDILSDGEKVWNESGLKGYVPFIKEAIADKTSIEHKIAAVETEPTVNPNKSVEDNLLLAYGAHTSVLYPPKEGETPAQAYIRTLDENPTLRSAELKRIFDLSKIDVAKPEAEPTDSVLHEIYPEAFAKDKIKINDEIEPEVKVPVDVVNARVNPEDFTNQKVDNKLNLGTTVRASDFGGRDKNEASDRRRIIDSALNFDEWVAAQGLEIDNSTHPAGVDLLHSLHNQYLVDLKLAWDALPEVQREAAKANREIAQRWAAKFGIYPKEISQEQKSYFDKLNKETNKINIADTYSAANDRALEHRLSIETRADEFKKRGVVVQGGLNSMELGDPNRAFDPVELAEIKRLTEEYKAKYPLVKDTKTLEKMAEKIVRNRVIRGEKSDQYKLNQIKQEKIDAGVPSPSDILNSPYAEARVRALKKLSENLNNDPRLINARIEQAKIDSKKTAEDFAREASENWQEFLATWGPGKGTFSNPIGWMFDPKLYKALYYKVRQLIATLDALGKSDVTDNARRTEIARVFGLDQNDPKVASIANNGLSKDDVTQFLLSEVRRVGCDMPIEAIQTHADSIIENLAIDNLVDQLGGIDVGKARRNESIRETNQTIVDEILDYNGRKNITFRTPTGFKRFRNLVEQGLVDDLLTPEVQIELLCGKNSTFGKVMIDDIREADHTAYTKMYSALDSIRNYLKSIGVGPNELMEISESQQPTHELELTKFHKTKKIKLEGLHKNGSLLLLEISPAELMDAILCVRSAKSKYEADLNNIDPDPDAINTYLQRYNTIFYGDAEPRLKIIDYRSEEASDNIRGGNIKWLSDHYDSKIAEWTKILSDIDPKYLKVLEHFNEVSDNLVDVRRNVDAKDMWDIKTLPGKVVGYPEDMIIEGRDALQHIHEMLVDNVMRDKLEVIDKARLSLNFIDIAKLSAHFGAGERFNDRLRTYLDAEEKSLGRVPTTALYEVISAVTNAAQTGAVAFRITTAVKHSTSILNTLCELANPIHFAKGAKNWLIHPKESMAEALKYSSIIRALHEGSSSSMMSSSQEAPLMGAWQNRPQGEYGGIGATYSRWASKMLRVSNDLRYAQVWEMAKSELPKQENEANVDYMRRVALRAEQIVYRTEQTNDPSSISNLHLAAKSNPFLRMLIPLSAQLNKNFNIMVSNFNQMLHGSSGTKEIFGEGGKLRGGAKFATSVALNTAGIYYATHAINWVINQIKEMFGLETEKMQEDLLHTIEPMIQHLLSTYTIIGPFLTTLITNVSKTLQGEKTYGNSNLVAETSVNTTKGILDLAKYFHQKSEMSHFLDLQKKFNYGDIDENELAEFNKLKRSVFITNGVQMGEEASSPTAKKLVIDLYKAMSGVTGLPGAAVDLSGNFGTPKSQNFYTTMLKNSSAQGNMIRASHAITKLAESGEGRTSMVNIINSSKLSEDQKDKLIDLIDDQIDKNSDMILDKKEKLHTKQLGD